MLTGSYVDYSKLSPRTLAKISTYQASLQDAIVKNEYAVIFDKFEADTLGKSVYGYSDFTYSSPYLSITVDSGETVKQVLRWFSREVNFRVREFEDRTASYQGYREYTLENRDDLEGLTIELKVAFSGTCEFVDEPTGEFEDVPEIIGIPAHRRQVMKKVLKCGSDDLPSSA